MAAALMQAEPRLDAMCGLGERAVDIAVVDRLPGDEIVRAIEPRLGRAGDDGDGCARAAAWLSGYWCDQHCWAVGAAHGEAHGGAWADAGCCC